jgi:CBS domain containing-hemolysin-like protein
VSLCVFFAPLQAEPSSDETSLEEQKILMGIVTFGNTDTKQVMSPRIDIFALRNNESFADIYSKIIEKDIPEFQSIGIVLTHIEGVLFVKDLLRHLDEKILLGTL